MKFGLLRDFFIGRVEMGGVAAPYSRPCVHVYDSIEDIPAKFNQDDLTLRFWIRRK
jgi:hypothetical protein